MQVPFVPHETVYFGLNECRVELESSGLSYQECKLSGDQSLSDHTLDVRSIVSPQVPSLPEKTQTLQAGEAVQWNLTVHSKFINNKKMHTNITHNLGPKHWWGDSDIGSKVGGKKKLSKQVQYTDTMDRGHDFQIRPGNFRFNSLGPPLGWEPVRAPSWSGTESPRRWPGCWHGEYGVAQRKATSC